MTQDPDLDQAVKAMRYSARRVRTLQRMLAQPEDAIEYRKLASMQAELAELHEQFAVRGEKLCMADDRRLAGRALLMVTEEADRLSERYKRRPSFAQLLDAVRTADATCLKLREEASAEATLAIFARKVATHNAAATSSAVAYMEASR